MRRSKAIFTSGRDKFNAIHGETLERHRTRLLLFLYQHVRDENRETGKHRSRTDLWPFFVQHHELDGTRGCKSWPRSKPFCR